MKNSHLKQLLLIGFLCAVPNTAQAISLSGIWGKIQTLADHYIFNPLSKREQRQNVTSSSSSLHLTEIMENGDKEDYCALCQELLHVAGSSIEQMPYNLGCRGSHRFHLECAKTMVDKFREQRAEQRASMIRRRELTFTCPHCREELGREKRHDISITAGRPDHWSAAKQQDLLFAQMDQTKPREHRTKARQQLAELIETNEKRHTLLMRNREYQVEHLQKNYKKEYGGLSNRCKILESQLTASLELREENRRLKKIITAGSLAGIGATVLTLGWYFSKK